MAGIGEGLVSNMNMVEEVIVETVMPGDSFAFPEMMESGVAMEAGGAGEIQLQLVEHPKGRIQVVAGTNGDIIQIVDQTGNHPGVQAVIMAGDMAPKQLQILGNLPGVQAVSMAGDMAPKQLQILGNLPGVQAVSMAGDMAPKQLQILVNKRDPRKTKVKAKLKTKPESVKKNSLAIKISKRPTKTITMKVAATATSIICQFCWREFKKERLYEVHKKTHAKEDEPYVCRYCNSCFEKDSQRNRHMRKKHDYLKCLQCGASFDNKVFFERHMLMHSGQPIMYACKACGSTFTRKDYLVVHMELHKSEMPAGWDPASILPEDSGAPKKKGTKVKRGTLCCPRCNKTFKTLLLLQKHIAMHKRRFECHFCPKRFTTRMRRDDHMNVHAENSPYKSQKVLADKSSSSQHKSCQRIRETGEKPDQCAESTVRNHQLPHTEGKIECDVCHRKFARRYDMRKHRLCHGGQEHREGFP
ncbi:uncharacterized protein [Diadema antillarum]|uniref:uncharacterized protein n=1 Tax=Diadema antillarum TaxID=105358 RepID=UPI003A8681AE